MSKRIALVGIIVEDKTEIYKVNELLHEYGNIIVGRMGIPYNNINIISIAVDGEQDDINTLSGKLGALSGISVKTMYTKF